MSEQPDLIILNQIRNKIPEAFKIEQQKKWEVLKRKGYSQFSCRFVKTNMLKSLNRFSLQETAKFDEFCDELDQLSYGSKLDVIKELEGFKESIKPKIKEGFHLDSINNIEQMDITSYEARRVNFKPKSGYTNLIVFWSSEFEKSSRALNELNLWLSQNQKFRLQINPIAISLDDEHDSLKIYLKAHQITQFQHYRFPLGWDATNAFQRAMELNYLPKIVILSKDGDVVGITRKAREVEDLIKNHWEEESESENEGKFRELLDQQTFRFIKKALIHQIADQLNNTQFAKSDFIRLSLTKAYKITPDGTREIVERSHLKISYEVSVQSKQRIKSFINNVVAILGQSNVLVKRSILKDPLGMVEMITNGFQDVLQKHGKIVEEINEKIEIFDYSIEKQEFSPNVISQSKMVVNNLNFKEYQEIYGQVQPILKKYQQEVEESDDDPDNDEEQDDDKQLIVNHINDLTESLQSGLALNIGNLYQPIQNYHSFTQQEIENIQHTENQVLVVMYWNDSPQCKKSFTNILKILIANEEQYQGKVKFVALSQNKQEDYESFFSANKGIEEIISFYFPFQNKQVDQVQYNVKSFPHFVVVDKIGTIRLMDSVEDLESITQIYLDETVESIQQKGPLNEEEYSKLTQFLLSDSIKKLAPLNNKRQFNLSIVLKEIEQRGSIIHLVPIIQYLIRDSKQKYIDSFLTELDKIVPLASFQINKTIQRTISFVFPGKQCRLCQTVLNGELQQYYCPFTDDFYCVKCAESGDSTNLGYNKFRVKDNLIFFNAPLTDKSVLNDVDQNRLGHNLKVKKGEKFNQNHAVDCNGCDRDVQGFRYIALNCLPGKLSDLALVDFCEDCFNQIKTGGSQLEMIVKRTQIYGYNPSMLLLRVPFYMGYYDY